MNKLSSLRAEFSALNAELRVLGVKVFPYEADKVEGRTPANLRSCITWAKETLANIQSAACDALNN
jgi:hypothetical protein